MVIVSCVGARTVRATALRLPLHLLGVERAAEQQQPGPGPARQVSCAELLNLAQHYNRYPELGAAQDLTGQPTPSFPQFIQSIVTGFRYCTLYKS